MRRLAKAAFFVAALPLVARASLRLAWLERRMPLESLVSRLRATRSPALHPLARPERLLAVVDRLLPLLPPWRYGACLKRSLLLLDLWSRCGLQPRLHLGVRREGEGVHRGHAWVTVADPRAVTVAAEGGAEWPVATGALPPATSSQGYPEAFVF
jgi:hypothetical protein